jgi:hypothetical protein
MGLSSQHCVLYIALHCTSENYVSYSTAFVASSNKELGSSSLLEREQPIGMKLEKRTNVSPRMKNAPPQSAWPLDHSSLSLAAGAGHPDKQWSASSWVAGRKAVESWVPPPEQGNRRWRGQGQHAGR